MVKQYELHIVILKWRKLLKYCFRTEPRECFETYVMVRLNKLYQCEFNCLAISRIFYEGICSVFDLFKGKTRKPNGVCYWLSHGNTLYCLKKLIKLSENINQFKLNEYKNSAETRSLDHKDELLIQSSLCVIYFMIYHLIKIYFSCKC